MPLQSAQHDHPGVGSDQTDAHCRRRYMAIRPTRGSAPGELKSLLRDGQTALPRKHIAARVATAGRRRCLGLSRATKDVTTKDSEGMPFAIAGLVRPPVLYLGRSSHGLRLASQSCKVCRIALPPWSARRNICRSGLALRDIRCSPYLPYGIRGPQAHRPCNEGR